MWYKKMIWLTFLIIFVGLVYLAVDNNFFLTSGHMHNEEVDSNKQEGHLSPYVGQQDRNIKALSQSDIEGLLAGSGTPFGGMAKPAELNGYPGPKHILELADSLELNDRQEELVEEAYESMRSEAVGLGKELVEFESKLDNNFSQKNIDNDELKNYLDKSADIYGQLRYVHLKTHLAMVDILNSEQIEKYNQLRGYHQLDPCQNTPKGYNEELWKEHNNCKF